MIARSCPSDRVAREEFVPVCRGLSVEKNAWLLHKLQKHEEKKLEPEAERHNFNFSI